MGKKSVKCPICEADIVQEDPEQLRIEWEQHVKDHRQGPEDQLLK